MDMRITIGSQLTIENPSSEILKWCKDNLILDNPEYAKKVRMGFWVGNTPKTLNLSQSIGNKVVIPFGCLREILPMLKGADIKHDFAKFEKLDFANHSIPVPLYDYQEEAVASMMIGQYGILQSPAGSGKTQMGIALAAMFGKPILWLTHTQDLLKQSRDRAAQYLDPDDFGTITEGKVNIGKTFTFATVQTMANIDLAQYKYYWDCIIVDECHRVAGTPTAVSQFSKVLNALAARHKYGLSATVHRGDGMIKATYALLGRVVYTVPDEAVASKVMPVEVHPRRTGCTLTRDCLNTDGTINYAKTINHLCEDTWRNAYISAELVSNADRFNLILSDRVSHLRTLYDRLPKSLKATAAVIDGKMTSKKAKLERAEAIEKMRTGENHYLFATYALAKEGLDIPRLDRLYLATPQKDYAVIVQSVGRVGRTFPGKQTPIAYDYIDSSRGFERSFKTRCTHYRKCGCTIVEG